MILEFIFHTDSLRFRALLLWMPSLKGTSNSRKTKLIIEK